MSKKQTAAKAATKPKPTSPVKQLAAKKQAIKASAKPPTTLAEAGEQIKKLPTATHPVTKPTPVAAQGATPKPKSNKKKAKKKAPRTPAQLAADQAMRERMAAKRAAAQAGAGQPVTAKMMDGNRPAVEPKAEVAQIGDGRVMKYGDQYTYLLGDVGFARALHRLTFGTHLDQMKATVQGTVFGNKGTPDELRVTLDRGQPPLEKGTFNLASLVNLARETAMQMIGLGQLNEADRYGLNRNLHASDPVRLKANVYADAARLLCLQFNQGFNPLVQREVFADLYAEIIKLQSYPPNHVDIRQRILLAAQSRLTHSLSLAASDADGESGVMVEDRKLRIQALTTFIGAVGDIWFNVKNQLDRAFPPQAGQEKPGNGKEQPDAVTGEVFLRERGAGPGEHWFKIGDVIAPDVRSLGLEVGELVAEHQHGAHTHVHGGQ